MDDSSNVFRIYSGIAFTDVSLLFVASNFCANPLLLGVSLIDNVLDFSVDVERFNSVVVANVVFVAFEVLKTIVEASVVILFCSFF